MQSFFENSGFLSKSGPMSEGFDLQEMALKSVQKLNPYQPGKPISELERELGLKKIVKLASNENPLGTSPKVEQAVRESLSELTRYPDGNGFELKQALAARLDVQAEQITLGNGSNDVLDLIARVFLDPSKEAVFSEYAFAVYPISTQAVGATARIAPAGNGEKWPRFGHDLDKFSSLIGEKTAVIFIANPNNPTGTWLTRHQLESFLDNVPSRVIVVVDEAYFEYVGFEEYPNAVELLSRYPNLIVTRTFSKAYGLAGLRVGYAVSSVEIADLLNRVRQPFNVNSLALLAACTALEDESYLEKSREFNRKGLGFLASELVSRGFDVIPSAGNFLSVDMGKPAGAVYDALLRQGVIVRPVANYQMPNHLRVSVGTPEENLFFINALDAINHD